MTKKVLVVAVILIVLSAFAAADTFNGALFYTNYTGGVNVNTVNYSYDDTTHTATLSGNHGIAATSGADGIIFAPNGNLLIGGQGNPFVHEITTGGVFVTDHSTNGSATFHLTLDPNGGTVYTSTFGGVIEKVSLTGGPTVTQAPFGGDFGVTQLAFAPNGNVIYVDGSPNGGGNIGTYDLLTGHTNRLYSSVPSAHGVVFDPFSGRFTFFGAGSTGTTDQNGGGLASHATGVCDFDQGAVDGKGHALVAGCSGITFIDYRISGDINHPDFLTFFSGFGGIDDVAPLVGAGSQNNTPEPGTLLLLGTGLITAAGSLRKRYIK